MLTKKRKTGAVDKEQEKRKKSGLYSLFLMLIGGIIAIAVGVFFYVSSLGTGKSPDLNKPATVEPLPSEQTSSEYKFYEILPKQEFIGVPEGVSLQTQESINATPTHVQVDTTVTKPQIDDTAEIDDTIEIVEDFETYDVIAKKPHKNTTYILQVRSYDEPTKAELKLGEVIMSGVDAQIVKRDEGDGSILYQVISMPINDYDELTMSYERLKNNGIDSIIVKQEH